MSRARGAFYNGEREWGFRNNTYRHLYLVAEFFPETAMLMIFFFFGGGAHTFYSTALDMAAEVGSYTMIKTLTPGVSIYH